MPRCNEQVKKLRFQTQLSQNKLAGRAGIDSATYRRAENGNDNVAELTVERIASALSTLLKRPISSASLVAEETDTAKAAKSAAN